MDESIQVIKQLGGGGDTAGVVDMINDLKAQLNADVERIVDGKIRNLNDRIMKMEQNEEALKEVDQDQ